MICEYCEKSHNGEYGSGRFCNSKCARGFSTKDKRSEINRKVSGIMKKRAKEYPEKFLFTRGLSEDQEEKRIANHLAHYESLSFDEIGWDAKRKRVILEQDGKCNKCGISEWMGSTITLEIDHINGINDDNRRENLEGLCPNCHSITETWRGRNKSTGRQNVSDATLIEALKTKPNIRQALLSVGLAAKGGNYSRAKKLLEEI